MRASPFFVGYWMFCLIFKHLVQYKKVYYRNLHLKGESSDMSDEIKAVAGTLAAVLSTGIAIPPIVVGGGVLLGVGWLIYEAYQLWNVSCKSAYETGYKTGYERGSKEAQEKAAEAERVLNANISELKQKNSKLLERLELEENYSASLKQDIQELTQIYRELLEDYTALANLYREQGLQLSDESQRNYGKVKDVFTKLLKVA